MNDFEVIKNLKEINISLKTIVTLLTPNYVAMDKIPTTISPDTIQDVMKDTVTITKPTLESSYSHLLNTLAMIYANDGYTFKLTPKVYDPVEFLPRHLLLISNSGTTVNSNIIITPEYSNDICISSEKVEAYEKMIDEFLKKVDTYLIKNPILPA